MAHVNNCVWPALGRLPQLDQRIDLTSAPRRRSRRDGASLVAFSARYRQPPSARGQAHAKDLVTERLDERHVTAQEAGRGLGDDLLVARMVEAEEPGEHPCRRVDGQGVVDVPRVDALYVDRAGAGCWLPGGRLRNGAIGLLRRVR
jgi:hypothetical protein